MTLQSLETFDRGQRECAHLPKCYLRWLVFNCTLSDNVQYYIWPSPIVDCRQDILFDLNVVITIIGSHRLWSMKIFSVIATEPPLCSLSRPAIRQ